MRLRGSPLDRIANAIVRIRAHGINVNLMDLEAEYIKDPRQFDTYVEVLIEENDKKKKAEIVEAGEMK